MSTNSTSYKVVEYHGTANEVTLRRGNLRQCWLYLFNTYAENLTATYFTENGILIIPEKKGT